MSKYKGLTVNQSAAKLLERMKLRPATAMAERYMENSEDGTDARHHWREVRDLLASTNALNLNAVFDAAEADATQEAATVTQKQSKNKGATTASPTPAEHAEAQLSREAAADALDKVRELARYLDRELTKAHNSIASFAAEVVKNPAHTLEWSHSTFKCAARIHVLTMAMQSITDENGKPTAYKVHDEGAKGLKTWDTVPYLMDYAQREVNRRSGNAGMSTSPTSNLMDREMLAAWAEVIEIIKWRS